MLQVSSETRVLLEEYTTTKTTTRISTGSKHGATKLIMLGGPASVTSDHLSVILKQRH